ncbi:cellulose biosynthesis protein BcsR [Pseudomonas sp. UMAB-08]|uniref:cellulose biosynthesis protein BcsR n=1 Tax=Pseudomonas sp. UMAB-08 TaxID=1365375 RepID=UPI001C5599B7|nr:cellulose biosynthesis protein BcsR [Pseudomonas sp. UMAB-08]
MATLPAKIPVKGQMLTRTEWADDIARLKVELQLPSLEYVDISAQVELARAMERWPLLAEYGFAAESEKPPLPVDRPVQLTRFGVSK